jgi:hypothetical protein
MTPDQEKILIKVKKMLALAGDSAASEGERDNAMRMAHTMLARYNLSLSEVDTVGANARVREFQEEGAEWSIRISQGIAELFFCHYYFQRHRERQGAPWTIRHFYIGQPANVTTAQLLSRYAIDSIKKESAQYSDRARNASFCTGASNSLSRRCADMRKRAEPPDATPGTAMVLKDYYTQENARNAAWLRAKGVKLQTEKILGNTSARDAYHKGADFAKGINLSPLVAQGGPLSLDYRDFDGRR